MSKIKKPRHQNILPDRKNKKPGSSRQTRGQYANYFEIGYNAFEFVLDFGQSFHESDETELYARIILSPGCAKDLCSVLEESIDQYTKKFESDNNQ